MAKNEKTNSLFGTELSGFKKKQVNEYIASLEKSHQESLEKTEKLRNELQTEYDALQTQYDELLEKYNELQHEKAQVASVLINAEKNAAQIISDARKEAELEKERLALEAEEIRRIIVNRNGALNDMKKRSAEILDSLLGEVRNAVESFEEYIVQGRAQLDEDTERLNDDVAVYENGEDVLSNEFDIGGGDESLGEVSSELFEDEADPEYDESADGMEEDEDDEADGAAGFVFADMQARDDGVDAFDFDVGFSELRLDDTDE